MERLRISLFVLSKLFLLVFIFLVLVVSIPESSISFSNFRSQIFLRTIMPEGWAFFTRDPRESDYEYFEIKNGTLRRNNKFPFSIPANFFGLKRTPKLLNSELFMVMNQLDSSVLRQADGCTLKELSLLKPTFHNVRNPSKTRLLQDSICVILYKPIPWAWSTTMTQHENQCEYMFLCIE